MSDQTIETTEYVLTDDERAAIAEREADHIRRVVRGADLWLSRTNDDGTTVRMLAAEAGAVFAPTPPPKPVTKLTAAERAHIIADYIREEVTNGADPAALTVRTVARAVGIPYPTVYRSPVWDAFQTWREGANIGQLRTRTLTSEMLAVIADRAADDPAAAAEANELAALIADQRRDMADDDR